MNWSSLVVASLISALITWVVAHFYFRWSERGIRALPDRRVEALVQHGLILTQRENEARAVARGVVRDYSGSQTEMNLASHRDFEEADLDLQSAYTRLHSMLDPQDRLGLQEAQEAWRSFRDKQVRLVGGFYKGGSVQPLVHNTTALALTEERRRQLKELHDELRSR